MRSKQRDDERRNNKWENKIIQMKLTSNLENSLTMELKT